MDNKFTEYSQLNLSDVNKEVLKKWDENDVFSHSMTEREGCPSFVFYEGPPSANGMPGIHHVMARTIKDTFCRYKTMKGFQVKRKAGLVKGASKGYTRTPCRTWCRKGFGYYKRGYR